MPVMSQADMSNVQRDIVRKKLWGEAWPEQTELGIISIELLFKNIRGNIHSGWRAVPWVTPTCLGHEKEEEPRRG